MNAKKNNSNVLLQADFDLEKRAHEVYGDDYLKWKDWGHHAIFGTIAKSESAYFAAELARSRHKFPSKSRVL